VTQYGPDEDGRIVLPHLWKPRPYQQPLWNYLSTGGKRAVSCWHRRSGKDDCYLNHVACAAHERVGNIWYMLPEYSQARKSMWTAMTERVVDGKRVSKRRIDWAFPDAVRAKVLEQEMMIEFKNGSTFQLVGSDNFNSLVGSPPVGLVFSEYALSAPSSWGYLMPILEENGGWAAFNSTPRGKNHFKRLCEFAAKEPGWFFSSVTADTSGVFTPDQLSGILRQLQAEHGDEYGMALFQQEYYVSFEAAMPGSIWGDCLLQAQTAGRIGTDEHPVEVPYDPTLPVFTGWDLGFDDDTTTWFYQITPGDSPSIAVIDYEEARFKDIEWYCEMLRDRGYTYGTHWFPHDARPRTLAAGGKSILQQFTDWNRDNGQVLGRFAIAPKLDVQEGIQAARATFPRCRFDTERTADGVDHLKAYRREYDEERNMFSSQPLHNGDSHAADGWRTVAVTWRQSKRAAEERPLMDRLMDSNVVGMEFGRLKRDHLRRMREARER